MGRVTSEGYMEPSEACPRSGPPIDGSRLWSRVLIQSATAWYSSISTLMADPPTHDNTREYQLADSVTSVPVNHPATVCCQQCADNKMPRAQPLLLLGRSQVSLGVVRITFIVRTHL